MSGVRNSWLASATKRRNLFSPSVRAVNDSSMRESMAFKELTNLPTSVSGFASGKRAERSPSAIFSATSSTSASGLKPILITIREAIAINKSAIKPIKIKIRRSRLDVSSTPERD